MWMPDIIRTPTRTGWSKDSTRLRESLMEPLSRSRKVSMARDSGLNLSNNFEIGQAPRLSRCPPISGGHNHYNTQSRGYETSQNLAARRPFSQWIEALVVTSPPAAELLSIPVPRYCMITHWGRVTHICVNKLTRIGSDHGLSPDRRQAIIWTKMLGYC